MTIDQYSLNDGEYTKLFLKNADQLIDLYHRFSNKLTASYQMSVPEDVKRQLFDDVIYKTNDCAREKHKEEHPESIELYVSNAELKKEIDSLKAILQAVLLNLVDTLITAEENKPIE